MSTSGNLERANHDSPPRRFEQLIGSSPALEAVLDGVKRAQSRLPQGPSAIHCDECGTEIPEARRKALPGTRLCVTCQDAQDRDQAAYAGYNRRGSKDSQLR